MTKKGMTWTSSTHVCPHEYLLRSQDPQLAEEINKSTSTERFQGKVYHVLFRDGYKYWLMSAIINRKRQTRTEWLKDPYVTDQRINGQPAEGFIAKYHKMSHSTEAVSRK